MKKVAKFNPNVRNVGDVLTSSIAWALFSDAHDVMTKVARHHVTSSSGDLELESHKMTAETARLLPTTLKIVRQLRPEGVEAMHQPRSPRPIDTHGRLQTTFHAETREGESVLHMIKADRRPHPLLEKRGKELYLVCHYYLYPDREEDNVHWEIETFKEVTPERLASYLSTQRESSTYPPLEDIKLACMTYLNYEFGQATNRRTSALRTLASRPSQLIAAMGTLSTQALLEEMRVRWADGVLARKDDLWSAQEKCFLDVPTYPFEFNVDPTQRVESSNPNQDDCEVWELFVYRVENDAMATTTVVRYTNEHWVLNKLGTSVSDRQARRHGRLSAKYREMAEILRTLGRNSKGPELDIYSDRLGAKVLVD